MVEGGGSELLRVGAALAVLAIGGYAIGRWWLEGVQAEIDEILGLEPDPPAPQQCRCRACRNRTSEPCSDYDGD